MGSRKKLLGIGLFAVGSLLFTACGDSDSAMDAAGEDNTVAAATGGPSCTGTEAIKMRPIFATLLKSLTLMRTQ